MSSPATTAPAQDARPAVRPRPRRIIELFLLVLAVGATLTVTVLDRFVDTLDSVVVLALFSIKTALAALKEDKPTAKETPYEAMPADAQGLTAQAKRAH